MADDKYDVGHIEKASTSSSSQGDAHPEQDWTLEEEKAVVYVVDCC